MRNTFTYTAAVMVGMLLTSAIPLRADNNTSAPSTALDHPQQASVPLDDYLLSRDFVITGHILPSVQQLKRGAPLQIHVDRVVLGAVPHSAILINALTLTQIPAAGAPVIAWGGWHSAIGDTCLGGLIMIAPQGGMSSHLGDVVFTLDGIPTTIAGSYGRLLSSLDRRGIEHPSVWLASGSSVELVRITAMDVPKHLIRVQRLATLTGSTSGQIPSHILLPEGQRCRFVPHIGDSLLVSAGSSNADTLTTPVCPEHLLVHGSQPTVLGVRVDQIRRILTPGAKGLVLARVHGVDRNAN